MEESKNAPKRELTEVEEWELERKMVSLAFKNSYLILTEKTTFEKLMYRNHELGKSAVLAHDPHEGATRDELENIIEYFIEQEEYEKCSELKPLLKCV